MPSTPRYARRGRERRCRPSRAAPRVEHARTRASPGRAATCRRPGEPVGSATRRPRRPRRRRAAASSWNGGTYDFTSFIRPRMYGSTDMNTLRTRTWPGPGAGTLDLDERGSSPASGKPCGREASWISRLAVSVVRLSAVGAQRRPPDGVDVDVAAGRVGVRADLVGRVDELLGDGRGRRRAGRPSSVDGEAEAAAAVRADADLGASTAEPVDGRPWPGGRPGAARSGSRPRSRRRRAARGWSPPPAPPISFGHGQVDVDRCRRRCGRGRRGRRRWRGRRRCRGPASVCLLAVGEIVVGARGAVRVSRGGATSSRAAVELAGGRGRPQRAGTSARPARRSAGPAGGEADRRPTRSSRRRAVTRDRGPPPRAA